VATLFHVTLDLPVKLDIRADVKVEAEVNELPDPLVYEGVEALNDDDGSGLNLLWLIKSSIGVVVNGLHDRLSVLERLHVFEHKIELLLGRVEGCEARDLASLTIVEMVIIKADDSSHVRDEGVRLPTSIGAESSTKRTTLITSEGRGNTTHKRGLSAAGIGSEADDDGGFTILQCLERRGRAHATESGGHERASESRGGGDREGSGGH